MFLSHIDVSLSSPLSKSNEETSSGGDKNEQTDFRGVVFELQEGRRGSAELPRAPHPVSPIDVSAAHVPHGRARRCMGVN